MYFIELVTTEHKVGITTLCIKKSAPGEKWKQSVFNIPFFLILCSVSALLSLSLPSLLAVNVCRNQATLFLYPIIQRIRLAFSPLQYILPPPYNLLSTC